MDVSPIGLARAYIPALPVLITTIVLSVLRLFTRNDRHPQDVLTAIIVALMRPIMSTPGSLAKSQAQWLTDFGIWGRMWVAKTTVPRPERYSGGQGVVDVKEAVRRAIECLGDEGARDVPFDVADVDVEWTGYRRGVSPIAMRANLSEKEHYGRMMGEVGEECATILYFHGGAFW
jgi:hypothetical protein